MIKYNAYISQPCKYKNLYFHSTREIKYIFNKTFEHPLYIHFIFYIHMCRDMRNQQCGSTL